MSPKNNHNHSFSPPPEPNALDEFRKLKPSESNNAALARYEKELEALARDSKKTVKQLVADAENADLVDALSERVLELTELIAALRKP